MKTDIESRRDKGERLSEWLREAVEGRRQQEDAGEWPDVSDPLAENSTDPGDS